MKIDKDVLEYILTGGDILFGYIRSFATDEQKVYPFVGWREMVRIVQREINVDIHWGAVWGADMDDVFYPSHGVVTPLWLFLDQQTEWLTTPYIDPIHIRVQATIVAIINSDSVVSLRDGLLYIDGSPVIDDLIDALS